MYLPRWIAALPDLRNPSARVYLTPDPFAAIWCVSVCLWVCIYLPSWITVLSLDLGYTHPKVTPTRVPTNNNILISVVTISRLYMPWGNQAADGYLSRVFIRQKLEKMSSAAGWSSNLSVSWNVLPSSVGGIVPQSMYFRTTSEARIHKRNEYPQKYFSWNSRHSVTSSAHGPGKCNVSNLWARQRSKN